MDYRRLNGLGCGMMVAAVACGGAARGQIAQKGEEATAPSAEKLRVEYVGYRTARYETEAVFEPDNERPNRGGLISVYLTNVSKKPVTLAYYRANDKDASHWRLNGFLAWDRIFDKHLEPGEMTVQEINALTPQFAAGAPFRFGYVDRTWRPALRYETTLAEDPVQISLVRVMSGMTEIEVHVRHTEKGHVQLQSVEVHGHDTTRLEWASERLDGPGHTIARAHLDPPLSSAELLIVKVEVKENDGVRPVYAHRRAFEDWFPIGCWTATPETYGLLRRHHIELVVPGGHADDTFYTQVIPKYGFRTLGSTGPFSGLDMVRSLGDHPAVAGWMLADEPDWRTEAVVMMHSDAFVRRYNQTKPTFITMCRNVKFFEYAAIADIPCMDHYCVTAPTSSKWPHRYGTRLEETAYYTRDLKAACEPKPIWVWTQGIANWDERPRRPVPTPEELAAQLLFNLGRGAKGILWFDYVHIVAERFPDTREAMRRWGRVLRVVRDDLLAAEPIDADVRAPDQVDIAVLASWDKLIVCANNLDYEIHPEAYPFTLQRNVQVSLRLPVWLEPAVALLVTPDGIEEVSFQVERRRATIELGDLRVCKLVVLANDAKTRNAYQEAYELALRDEQREEWSR